jgi:hypothetical protein
MKSNIHEKFNFTVKQILVHTDKSFVLFNCA